MLEELTQKVEEKGLLIRKLREEIGKIIVGQDYMIERKELMAIVAAGIVVVMVVGVLLTTFLISS